MRITSADLTRSYQLTGFRVHDANVIGACYGDEGPFVLAIRRVDEVVTRIAFIDVTQFGFREFRNGAIISDIFVWPVAEAPTSASTHEDGAWAIVFGNHLPLSHLPAEMERVAAAGMSKYLVAVETSYGGGIAVLCNDIDVDTPPVPWTEK